MSNPKSSSLMTMGTGSAGNALRLQPILTRYEALVTNQPPTGLGPPQNFLELAERLKAAYIEYRKELILDQILQKQGLDWQSFYGNSTGLHAMIVDSTMKKINDFDVGIQIVIAGIDSAGPHLAAISHPNDLEHFNEIGYIASGSGHSHALTVFFRERKSVDESLENGLLTTLLAKRAAEAASGVGEATDVIILGPGGNYTLEAEELADLWEQVDDFESRRHSLVEGLKLPSAVSETIRSYVDRDEEDETGDVAVDGPVVVDPPAPEDSGNE